MKEIEKAKVLFREAGLAFPLIPQKLALKIKEQSPWYYLTDPHLKNMSIFNPACIKESSKLDIDDYAILCHAGYGSNSYYIFYYLVSGSLRMFLNLSWGGMSGCAKWDAARINECFDLSDQIIKIKEKENELFYDKMLLTVAADNWGYWWSPDWKSGMNIQLNWDYKTPQEVLKQALERVSSQE